jgi:hypothetical protein
MYYYHYLSLFIFLLSLPHVLSQLGINYTESLLPTDYVTPVDSKVNGYTWVIAIIGTFQMQVSSTAPCIFYFT